MKIDVVGIPIGDREAAVQFDTGTTGFVKKHDWHSPGEGNRWLTVVAAEDSVGSNGLKAGSALKIAGKNISRYQPSDI